MSRAGAQALRRGRAARCSLPGARRSRRGAVAPLALAAVLILGILATIGLAARTTSLGFESRSLGRVCARWAAEAALAEARGTLAEGRRVERVAGTLPAATGFTRASYAATLTAGPGTQDVRAEGTCVAVDGRPSRAVLSVRFVLHAGKWEVSVWSEGEPAAPAAGDVAVP